MTERERERERDTDRERERDFLRFICHPFSVNVKIVFRTNEKVQEKNNTTYYLISAIDK